jgi:hypothetical protein
MMRSLRSMVEELEQDRTLDQPDRLRRRVEALDRLEAYLAVQLDDVQLDDGQRIYHRARALYAQLEAANFRSLPRHPP